MAEIAGPRFAFADETVVIVVYFDDLTGHPTRVTSTNGGTASSVTYTIANGSRTFSGTRTVPAGSDTYDVPTGLGNRIDLRPASLDAALEASHAA